MDRRRFVIGTAALGLGIGQAGLLLAAGREGNIAVHLDNPRALARMSGNDLRLGLLRNLLPARLYALRI